MKQGSDPTYQEPGDPVDSQQPGIDAGGTRVVVLLISLDEVSIARPGLPQSACLPDSPEHAREHGQQTMPEKDLWAAICEYPLVVRIKAIDLLAELQDPAFLPFFQSALCDDYWEVRAAAAQALGALKRQHLTPLFLNALQKETDEIVQQALVRALGKSRSEPTIPLLTRVIQDQEQDPLVREAAAWALGEFGKKAPILVLREVLREDPDEIVRETTAKVLEALQPGTKTQ